MITMLLPNHNNQTIMFAVGSLLGGVMSATIAKLSTNSHKSILSVGFNNCANLSTVTLSVFLIRTSHSLVYLLVVTFTGVIKNPGFRIFPPSDNKAGRLKISKGRAIHLKSDNG